jgi:hypothetical protein
VTLIFWGTFLRTAHWHSMRHLALMSCVLGFALFACATTRAETSTDRADADALPVPTAADVISQLYQFDLFQQTAVDRTDAAAASSDILTTAASRAEAAVKRDKALAQLQQQTGTTVQTDRKAAAMRAHGVVTIDRADGPSYVRAFYAAQLAEYELTVELLERYLQHPDNEDVGSFATAQLPALRAELKDTRNALADK